MIDGSPLDTWHHKKLPIGINRRLCVDRDRTVAIARDFWKRVESSGASDRHHADA